MSKLLTTILALFLFATFSNAQPKSNELPTTPFTEVKEVKISGKVLDKETNEPLEYATVAFYGIKEKKIVTGGITDANGDFSIPVPTGLYNVLIEYISFKTLTISNKKLTKNENLGTFSLELDTESLGEIEIIAERTTVEIKLDKKIYNVGKDLTVSGGSVSDVLDNVPSVSVDAEGGIALRGNDNVQILINGKPSGLVGLNSNDALRQLPADAIERVEVITSPSARYESEGTGGILNIILRRSKLLGLNGSISANVGYPDAAGLSGNINYRTGNVNIFSTTSYRYNESLGYWYNNVKNNDIATPDLDEKRDWTDIRKGVNTNTGIEWYINDSASLTSAIVYSKGNNANNSVNNTVQLNKENNTTINTLRLDPEKGDNETVQWSLNFTKDFDDKGQKLTFDFQLENSDKNENSLVNVNGTDTDLINTLTDQTKVLLRSDYTLPIGEKSQFEIGFRGDYADNTTDYAVELLNDDDVFELDQDLSNVLNFKQYINAFYTQFGSKVGKFSYLLGLRMENTRTTLDQPTSGDFKKKDLTGLFPTVNLNYELSDKESLMLGYNRRLRRPRGFMLNPFPSRSSITNVFQGNPDLDPTYSDKFELGYLNRFGKFTISTAIYYQHSINVMSFVSFKNGETVEVLVNDFNDNDPSNDEYQTLDVIQRGPVNLATDDRTGFELNLNYSPSRKWRVNTDFNFFKLKRDGEYNDINLDSDNTNWSLRLTNKLTLPYKIDWQTNMRYRGPSQDAQNNRKGRFSTKQRDGKRGFRVYPPWDEASNNQAKKTQEWQLNYFLDITKGEEVDFDQAAKLYSMAL